MPKYDSEEIKQKVQQRTGFDPEKLSIEELKNAEMLPAVLVLPKNLDERASVLADVLAGMVANKSGRVREFVGSIAHALSYATNSASWRDDELHDFDLWELQDKLARFSRSLNSSS